MFQFKWIALLICITFVGPTCMEYAKTYSTIIYEGLVEIANYDCYAKSPRYMIEILSPRHIIGIMWCIPEWVAIEMRWDYMYDISPFFLLVVYLAFAMVIITTVVLMPLYMVLVVMVELIKWFIRL